VATAGIALIAGAEVSVAARLALGMLGLQFAIGAANDLADETPDSVSRPDKPIPAGVLTRRQVEAIFAVSLSAGVLASASAGPIALVLGLVGLADGLVYDLRLKGTPFAWIALAAGVSLLPVYAWWGATGCLPAAFVGIVPAAFLAGAALALANALADYERDALAGTNSIATLIGRRAALAADAASLALVQAIAIATPLASWQLLAAATIAVELAGIGLGWIGLALTVRGIGRSGQLGWETQAVGVVVLGAGWLAALGAVGLLRFC
jgi:geranylgeranylglycerol-phosphate geranylgeranyltransferase